ncbi:MAG: hypothetical protein ACOYA9_00295 [Bilifractor sp.]
MSKSRKNGMSQDQKEDRLNEEDISGEGQDENSDGKWNPGGPIMAFIRALISALVVLLLMKVLHW